MRTRFFNQQLIVLGHRSEIELAILRKFPAVRHPQRGFAFARLEVGCLDALEQHHRPVAAPCLRVPVKRIRELLDLQRMPSRSKTVLITGRSVSRCSFQSRAKIETEAKLIRIAKVAAHSRFVDSAFRNRAVPGHADQVAGMIVLRISHIGPSAVYCS